MAKRKTVKLDKDLQSSYKEDYPKVKNAPAGYPPLLGMRGKTWYERAKNYERKYGKKVEPINNNLVDELNLEKKLNLEENNV